MLHIIRVTKKIILKTNLEIFTRISHLYTGLSIVKTFCLKKWAKNTFPKT